MAAQPQPRVVSDTELDNGGLLGQVTQVAIVTADLRESIASLTQLGIGPWAIYALGPDTTEVHYRGKRSEVSATIALATHGTMMWEVIQPTGGESLFQEFLDGGGTGFHHIGVDCDGIPYEEQAEQLRRRGYRELSGGAAFGTRFAYFSHDAPGSPVVEISHLPEGFSFPEPDEWYPAPPPVR